MESSLSLRRLGRSPCQLDCHMYYDMLREVPDAQKGLLQLANGELAVSEEIG